MKTLKEAKIGQTVKVVKLHGEGAVKRRIMDMGLTKGTEVYIRKVAPLGDPVEVTVRGYELSIRKADAEMLSLIHISAAGAGLRRADRCGHDYAPAGRYAFADRTLSCTSGLLSSQHGRGPAAHWRK